MKFREYKKLLAVITVSAMIAALPGSRVLAAPENVDGSVTNGNVESIIDNSFNLFPAEKNETVYVKTDANGKIRKIVVSDQLQNTGDTDTVKDHSNLTDIENVKGDESFKQSGSNLVWDNAGEDIVYQGESNAALPVGLSVTYELDGKKITPKKLEGKSGHLRVTYNYTNDLEQTGGRFTPFLMVTGVVLDQDHFKNVEVGSNGHFESGGQRMTVVGYSVPGLLDYLDIDEASADLSARLSLSNSFTFEADVEEYKTPLSGTIATNSIFSKMDSGDSIDSLDSLKSSLNTLADSSTQLVNGSAVLSSGVKELAGGASSLSSGVSKLTNGSRSLAEGTASLEKGAEQLNSGIGQMNDEVGSSMPVLTNAMSQLATGAENLSSGIFQAAAGAQAVSSGIGTVHESADQLAQGAASVKRGVQEVADGARKLAGGMQTAQKWRERLGKGRNPDWDRLIDKLSPLAFNEDSLYLAAESAPQTYKDIRFTSDHPAVLGALGVLPDNRLIDKKIMKKTLDWVWDNWNWDKTWGWDFPMVAMCAARLGEPERAVDALLMNKRTNTYLPNGHNYQDNRLRCYLPGNGGLLTAVAMMCAGWDGSTGKNPGFPADWDVRWEGLLPLP